MIYQMLQINLSYINKSEEIFKKIYLSFTSLICNQISQRQQK